MLELDLDDFDQDFNGGWRTLAYQGCGLEAAELIREWRFRKREHRSILYWHEGQLRASEGQTKQAIALFELTYKSPDLHADFGWNHYVDGTIAFLRNDKERLNAAIERLQKLPEPEDNSFTKPDGTVVKLSWPPNLNVLRGFQKCWGKSYKEAYGSECSSPATIPALDNQ
ncbi:MAG: hypothetical protein AAGH53_10575 [Pseudomonadota bacterium]